MFLILRTVFSICFSAVLMNLILQIKIKSLREYKDTIESLYINMDKMLGRILEKVDERTMVVVISDHGFASFNRGVNLNTWLLENDYLFLKDGNRAGEWLQ